MSDLLIQLGMTSSIECAHLTSPEKNVDNLLTFVKLKLHFKLKLKTSKFMADFSHRCRYQIGGRLSKVVNIRFSDYLHEHQKVKYIMNDVIFFHKLCCVQV